MSETLYTVRIRHGAGMLVFALKILWAFVTLRNVVVASVPAEVVSDE